MKTTEIKPLPKHVEDYVKRNTAFNMFGLLNISTLRAVTKTNLSDAELKKRIIHKYAHSFVNNKIEFNGCDKYDIREVKGHGDSHFEIFDTDTEKAISDNFLSKNIPKGYGKMKNMFIKTRRRYDVMAGLQTHKQSLFFVKYLNDNHKKQK